MGQKGSKTLPPSLRQGGAGLDDLACLLCQSSQIPINTKTKLLLELVAHHHFCAQGSKITALHLAALANAEGVVQQLVREGANPSQLAQYAELTATPLRSPNSGQPQSVLQETSQDKVDGGDDPAHIHADFLMEDDPFEIEREFSLGNLDEHRAYVTDGDNLFPSRVSPVDLALHAGNIGVIAAIVQENPNKGEYILRKAIAYKSVPAVQAVLERGLDANTVLDDASGATALHAAASLGEVGVVSTLLLQGASVAATDKSSNTPLHIALKRGHLEAGLALVNAGADLRCRGEDQLTPFALMRIPYQRLAPEEEFNQLAELFRAAVNADANLVVGVTGLLHPVVECGSSACVKILVEGGADVEAVIDDDFAEDDGMTPLLASCAGLRYHPEVVRCLLDLNARADVVDA